jgi:eukaryotic-like serine/threonine-protein kinase
VSGEFQLGPYRLINLMATGQNSQVWEAVEASSGRHFAVKLLLPEHVRSAEHRQFLFHEADVGKKLAHPNIIKIVSVVKDKDNPHFVMEFFPAGSLKSRLRGKQTDFIRERAHDIFKQWTTGLAFMHAKGWVHRDVKPDNVLVNGAGEVRIIDFALAYRIPTGLSRLFGRKGKTQGTRSYMSPEQIRGEPLDGRADIYSLGISFFEMITGRPPFRANTPSDLLQKQIVEKPENPRTYNKDITEDFAALVLRMLAKKKEDRFKDCHELLMAMRGIKVFKTEPPRKDAGTR